MKTTYAVGIVLVLAIGIFSVVAYQGGQQSAQSSTAAGSTTTTSASAGATSSAASTASSRATSGAGATTSSTATSSQAKGANGEFAMMATDPPVVASGVTAATATYNSLAVHTAGSGNATGWVKVNGSGSINLMSSANVSQTIGEAKIQSGTYDMARLSIQLHT
jgi:hypothetical protein